MPILLRLMMAATDRRVINIDTGGKFIVVIAVEVIPVGCKSWVEDPLHAAVFKQNVMHP